MKVASYHYRGYPKAINVRYSHIFLFYYLSSPSLLSFIVSSLSLVKDDKRISDLFDSFGLMSKMDVPVCCLLAGIEDGSVCESKPYIGRSCTINHSTSSTVVLGISFDLSNSSRLLNV